MGLSSRLLEILICPACRGEIRTVDDEAGIECVECGRVYPVRNGMPSMLIESASPPTRAKADDP